MLISCQKKHALKMNNPYVMILKPFPGLLADTKYDYFILFKNMDKLDLL